LTFYELSYINKTYLWYTSVFFKQTSMFSTFVSLADSQLCHIKPSVSAVFTCIFVSGYRKLKSNGRHRQK